MKLINYTHKGVDFQWGGGLNVYIRNDLSPLKLQLNNGSPSWRLNRTTWLSIKQLKKHIKKNNMKLFLSAIVVMLICISSYAKDWPCVAIWALGWLWMMISWKHRIKTPL